MEAPASNEEMDLDLPGTVDGPSSVLLFPRDEWDPEWRDPRVRVFREDPATRRWALHGYYPLDEVGEHTIAELFGGGKWVGQIIASDNRGVQDIKRTRRFMIPGPYRPPIAALPGLGLTAQPNAAPAAAAPAMVAESRERMSPNEVLNSMLLTQLLDVMKAGKEMQATRPDWTPLVIHGMELLGTFLTRPREDGSVDVLRRELQELRDTLRQREGPASSGIKDAVEAVKSLMEVKHLVDGEREEPASSGDAMLIGLGKEILGRMGPTAPAAAAAATPAPAMAPWQRLLMHFGHHLVQAATRGIPTDLAAEYTASLVPSEMEGVLVEFLARPDAATIIGQVVPAMQPFTAWTDRFVTELRAAYEGGDEGEEIGDG